MRLLCLITLLAVVAAATAQTGGDLAATRSGHFGGFAENLVQKLASTVTMRRLMGKQSDIEALPAWRGRIDPTFGRSYFAPSLAVNLCTGDKTCSTSLGAYPYEEYIIDPTGDSNQPVLKIGFPKGSWSPVSPYPGGTLFYAYPYKLSPTEEGGPISSVGAVLEYEVFFPEDFDFVKGGKLPGLSGGINNGRGCGGGADTAYCFSYKVMWRSQGRGEAFVFSKEHKEGDSIGRGDFVFQKGQWQKIRITIELNSPSKANGYLGLEFNGKLVISDKNVRWRNSKDTVIEAVEMASWFGGGTEDWASTLDTYVLLRNIKLYRSGPPTATDTQARSATGGITESFEQVVLTKVIPESPV